MKPLSKKAANILSRLMKITNEADSAICIERIEAITIGEKVSIFHSGTEITFLIYPNEMFFPIYYRNDALDIEYETVVFDSGKPLEFHRRKYSDLRNFCQLWMNSIKSLTV